LWGESDAYSHSYGDCYGNSNCDSNSNSNGYGNGYGNGDADSDSYSPAEAYTDAEAATDSAAETVVRRYLEISRRELANRFASSRNTNGLAVEAVERRSWGTCMGSRELAAPAIQGNLGSKVDRSPRRLLNVLAVVTTFARFHISQL
jgi:hypothetical protein